jgi:hypothetical protein
MRALRIIVVPSGGNLRDPGSRQRSDAIPRPSRKAVAVCAILSLSRNDAESFDLERSLRETASHINASAPRPIGDFAILDGAEAYERTLKYRVRFKDLSKEEISSAFVWKQTEFLTDFVCTTPEMKVFVENMVTLKYAYHDHKGALVVVITVDPRSCSRD